LVNTEPYRSLLPHPVFKHNDYLGVTTILTQGALRASLGVMKLVGTAGIDAISRVMGFLLVCMGVQFVINGVLELVTMQ
ncbi:MarC family protein, partial [Serratia nevei]